MTTIPNNRKTTVLKWCQIFSEALWRISVSNNCSLIINICYGKILIWNIDVMVGEQSE